jgi:uncharacterized protein (TIGR02284 family)
MSAETDTLTRLHTDAVDASKGYAEALEDSDGHSLFDLFRQMQTLHSQAASELADELIRLGAPPRESGSLLSLVHQSIMKLRSLVGGLDASVLPGLIDGEKRILASYDDALRQGSLSAAATAVVQRQRGQLSQAISQMQSESMQVAGAPLRDA